MAKRAERERGGLWHQPHMMNLLADLLIFASSLAFGYCAVAVAIRQPFFALREVSVVSALEHVSGAQIEYAARAALAGNFFTVKLDRVRGAFERLPWVRRVEARRVWPSGIELVVEEHVAAAVWNPAHPEQRLVNTHGEVFEASVDARLPEFAGPEGSSAEVLRSYREFSAMLSPLGSGMQAIALSSRRAWQLRMDDGLVIDLGRDQPKSQAAERLQRFVAVWPEAAARLPGRPAVIDLRYPAGFAVRTGRDKNVSRGEG